MSLRASVDLLAAATHHLTDADLARDYRWTYHDEGVRMALLGTNHELRELAVSLQAQRVAEGRPATEAQHALAQYHAAYLDLRALLLGFAAADFDRPPQADEWPMHTILVHTIEADVIFYALIRYALDRVRLEPSRSPAINLKAVEAILGRPYDPWEEELEGMAFGPLLEAYESHHQRLLGELAGISSDELQAPSVWWEKADVPVAFRLHRLEAHLRQHTIQAEKSMLALGYPFTEASRLLRLLYNGLAEAEGVLIGAPEAGRELVEQAATSIAQRAGEIAGIFA